MNDLSARSCKQLTVELEDHNLKTECHTVQRKKRR